MERLTVRVKEGNRKDECFIPGNKNAIKKLSTFAKAKDGKARNTKEKLLINSQNMRT